MGEVIRFPVERRLAQVAADQEPEYVQAPGWFGVRLRPDEIPWSFTGPDGKTVTMKGAP